MFVVSVVVVAFVVVSAKFINHKLLDYISSQQFRNLLTNRYQPNAHTYSGTYTHTYMYTFVYVCAYSV